MGGHHSGANIDFGGLILFVSDFSSQPMKSLRAVAFPWAEAISCRRVAKEGSMALVWLK